MKFLKLIVTSFFYTTAFVCFRRRAAGYRLAKKTVYFTIAFGSFNKTKYSQTLWDDGYSQTRPMDLGRTMICVIP